MLAGVVGTGSSGMVVLRTVCPGNTVVLDSSGPSVEQAAANIDNAITTASLFITLYTSESPGSFPPIGDGLVIGC